MATVNPYLTFNGNCEKAFLFYQSVFGGEIPYMGRFIDMPPMDGKTINPEDAEKIMHVNLPISKETTLYGSDSTSDFGGEVLAGNNFSISVNVESKEEADHIFNGLSAGANVTMPLHQSFWGAYFGMLVDQFGIAWMVNYDAPGEPLS